MQTYVEFNNTSYNGTVELYINNFVVYTQVVFAVSNSEDCMDYCWFFTTTDLVGSPLDLLEDIIAGKYKGVGVESAYNKKEEYIKCLL